MDNVCQLGEMILVGGKKITKKTNHTACVLYYVICSIEAAWIEFLCTIMMGGTCAANAGCCRIKQPKNAEPLLNAKMKPVPTCPT